MEKLNEAIFQFSIPDSEYKHRLLLVKKALKERGIDLGIGYFTPFMPGIAQYLTGFDPNIETGGIIVGTDVFILGGPEIEALARPVIRNGKIRTVMEFQVLSHKYPHAHYYKLKDVIKEAALKDKVSKVGILVRREFLPIHWLDMIKKELGESVEFVNAQDILDNLRYIKSEREIEAFRIATNIATRAVEAMLDALEPGMRELELAAIGDRVIKENGAYNYGLDTMVMSGSRINTIVGRATNKRIMDGELVSIGVTPRFEGYCGTVARTVVAGSANEDQLEFLEHGAKALQIAVANLKAGTPAKVLENAVIDYFKSVGLYDYVCYSVLHGIGLTEVLDEKSPRGDELITPGTTLMLDVGLFFHPKHNGFRHEDPYVIHHDGTVERLTDLPVDVFFK